MRFPTLQYDLIMADPPWKFETFSDKGLKKSAQAHYPCMETEDIKKLPVQFCAEENCLLWLWATAPMLTDAFEVLAAWGFTYKTMGVWHKRSKTWGPGCKNPKSAFGGGYILRSASEPYLIGTRGKPKIESRSVRNVIEAAVREHSRKPEQAYKDCELLCSGPKLELFARQGREGWDAWGNETEKFKVA